MTRYILSLIACIILTLYCCKTSENYISFYCYYTQGICLHRSAEMPMPAFNKLTLVLEMLQQHPVHFLCRLIYPAEGGCERKQRDLGLTLLATHKCNKATTPD